MPSLGFSPKKGWRQEKDRVGVEADFNPGARIEGIA
jgi:hypothetical protein